MTVRFTNKRKKKLINIKVFFIIFLIILLSYFFYLFFIQQKFSKNYVYFIQKYSNTYNFNLINIEINNLNNLNELDVLSYFDEYKGKSIFLIPIKRIAKDMQLNKWIKELNIQSDYKNTIKVFIEEEQPLGVYIYNNQRILFSKNQVLLKTLTNKEEFNELINFYGQNSINNSKALISIIENYLIRDVKKAIFIENRRWDLLLKNNILLKMPEKNMINALKNYNKIYKNVSNKDLKDIESIDLRINNQAIIKYHN